MAVSYHGGKQRIGKKLADIIYNESLDIEDEYEFTIRGYVEPFCGMLGVYQYIPELFKEHKPKLKYKAGDINKSVIAMWKAAQKGWKAPTKKLSKKEYNKLMKTPRSSAKKGFYGHALSFRSIYMSAYDHRAPASRLAKNSKKMKEIGKKLKNVLFSGKPYTQYSKLKNYIIYCDPPYEDTEQRYYDEKGKRLHFDSTKFWQWCLRMAVDNIVFVSSYKKPTKDFDLVSRIGKEKLYLVF